MEAWAISDQVVNDLGRLSRGRRSSVHTEQLYFDTEQQGTGCCCSISNQSKQRLLPARTARHLAPCTRPPSLAAGKLIHNLLCDGRVKNDREIRDTLLLQP